MLIQPKVSPSTLARRAPWESVRSRSVCWEVHVHCRRKQMAQLGSWAWRILLQAFTSTEGFCLTAFYPISEPQRHCRNTATVRAFLPAVPVAGEHIWYQTASNHKVLTSADRNSVSTVAPALLYCSVWAQRQEFRKQQSEKHRLCEARSELSWRQLVSV